MIVLLVTVNAVGFGCSNMRDTFSEVVLECRDGSCTVALVELLLNPQFS